jgi:carbohydrate-selective porin OprB
MFTYLLCPWMLGDWNGQRTALQAQGYDFSFGYTGEYAGILDSKNTSTQNHNLVLVTLCVDRSNHPTSKDYLGRMQQQLVHA